MTKKFDDLYEITKQHRAVLQLENMVYYFARKLSSGEYNSGMWESKEVKINDDESFWYFELQDNKTWTLCSENIQDDVKISTKCLSALSWMFAVNYILSSIYEDKECEKLTEELTELYYKLRDKIGSILDENETKIFYRAID